MNKKTHWHLKTTPDTKEFISKLHPEIKKIKHGILAILEEPEIGKNLKDELRGLRSFKTGKY